ncbi:WD40 repeat-like protein [Trametes coccinea BRFM310]|uniref:WD40 repeat-like protein n=1 Tax=Trametes coccinea (strain BRFM310) TaxID=1353009 RepID=A0A1Y2IUE7_TRAC3|nr:WD40 repeat-like protein [Trametes coccinea BRFM310]
MPHFPHTRLVFGDGQVLAVSGQHFHVLNVHTGEVIHSTTNLDKDALEKLNNTGPIRCAAVDSTFSHAITTGDDKKLKVWQVRDELKLLSERDLPKKPTEIGFTRDGQTIVVSDKFGDVFSYPLHPDPTPVSSTSQPGASKRGSLTAHENPSNGTLILGHASMLTSYLLTADEQYIITADRDEHIRVSWFPKGYVIERYCLSHEKFVSALHIPSFKSSVLVSGGGDPMLKVWDWMSGKLVSEIMAFDAVEPYIKVKAPKWRKPWHVGDGGEEDDASESKPKGKGRRRGKGKKGAEEAREHSADVEQQQEGTSKPAEPSADVEMAESRADTPATLQLANEDSEDQRLVFAVQRIQSVDRGEHGQFVLFSAVGASAVFYAHLPADGEKAPASSVRAVDLGKPVIDFTVGHDGCVWVLMDAEWGTNAGSVVGDARRVQILAWQDATLSEAPGNESPLVSALNTKMLVPATPAELKTLDLYSPLVSLPKNVDPEHDPLIRDTLSEVAAVASIDGEGKQLTQRELGRLKKKKALLAKIQEQEQQKQRSREGTTEVEADSGREVKRARSESAVEGAPEAGGGTNTGAETRDVEMGAS